MNVFNFSPGPAMLPPSVVEKTKEALFNFNGSKIGVMEISHRGTHFLALMEEIEANIRKLASISDDYFVLFPTGGATNQYSMLAMNLLPKGSIGNFILTDYWSEAALAEAKKFGETHIAASSKDESYRSIPKSISVSNNAAFLHFTSNNTLVGTQFQSEPTTPKDVPLLCDASSDIFCKPTDISKYGLIYAAAQKNLGPSGITLVILRKDLLSRRPKNLPILLDYATYAENNSLYNTIPTLPIYVLGEVVKWMLSEGGLTGIEKRNNEKAKIIYDALDRSSFYKPFAQKEDRSLMNVTFNLPTPELDLLFVEEAAKQGLLGLKGHKRRGGIRASIYNAFPKEGAQALASFMSEFEKSNG